MSLKEIVISSKEVEVIKLVDFYNLNPKQCTNQMNISMSEFNNLIKSARKKMAISLIEEIPVKIENEEFIEKEQEEEETTLCRFRCAVCGTVYSVNYIKDKIVCPLCDSTKVMSQEECGYF